MPHRYFPLFVLVVALVGGCHSSSNDGGSKAAENAVANAVKSQMVAIVAVPAPKVNALSYRVVPFRIADNNEPRKVTSRPMDATSLVLTGRKINESGLSFTIWSRFKLRVLVSVVQAKIVMFQVISFGGRIAGPVLSLCLPALRLSPLALRECAG